MQRPMGYVPSCLNLHDVVQLSLPGLAVNFARPRISENVGPENDSDLDLFRRAVAALCLVTVFHIMLHGAKVPEVKRTRPLLEAEHLRLMQLCSPIQGIVYTSIPIFQLQ